MFSGAFAEKVGTKAEKRGKKEREEKKGNDVSSFPLTWKFLLRIAKLFLVMTWEKVTAMT